MLKKIAVIVAATTLIAAPALAQQTLKIGFLGTFSGATSNAGNDMRDGFELGLDHKNRMLGGLKTEVIYGDDQMRPDVGKQVTDRFIESDKVNFLAGYPYSNVLLASLKSAIDSKTFLIGTNAGLSYPAGEHCTPWYFSVSADNVQRPSAMGLFTPMTR